MNNFDYQKFIDALEWRRRAWYVLCDHNLKQLADNLIQSYWSDHFFKNLPNHVSNERVYSIFEKYVDIINEIKITPFNSKTSLFLTNLFTLLINKKYETAYNYITSINNM